MIETSRLQISPITLTDCEEVRQLHNQPDVLMWLSDTHIVSQEEQIRWFNSLSVSKSSKRFVARNKMDEKLVGVFRLDRLDLENKSAEIGLDIASEFRRQGFAFEIYIGMLQYFFSKLNLHRLSLITLENNLPAISLYEKLGFTLEGRLRDAFIRENVFLDAYHYSLLSTEFKLK